MTEFEILKENLPKVDIMAYHEMKEAIQRILRQYHRVFLPRELWKKVVFCDSITNIYDDTIEVMISYYDPSGERQFEDLVELQISLITDEEKLKKLQEETWKRTV